MSTFRFRTIVTTHLYDTLEVNVHAVREFEGLEVGETDNRRAWSEVLYLLEPLDRERRNMSEKYKITLSNSQYIEQYS